MPKRQAGRPDTGVCAQVPALTCRKLPEVRRENFLYVFKPLPQVAERTRAEQAQPRPVASLAGVADAVGVARRKLREIEGAVPHVRSSPEPSPLAAMILATTPAVNPAARPIPARWSPRRSTCTWRVGHPAAIGVPG